MNKTIKTAISLSEDTYRRAEAFRRKLKKSRSEIYAEALQFYFRAQEVREKEALYATGYLAKPENAQEIEAGIKASSPIFEKEDW